MPESLLDVKNLGISFQTPNGRVHAVDDINFKISKGQTVGLVGESGCGKSVTALSLMRLLESPSGRIEDGSISLNGRNLVDLPMSDMRKIRGNSMSMIFQEPMTSLNPVFTIGNQISEVFRIHKGMNRHEAKEKSIEMLRLVNIPEAASRFSEYPHQLSGGMRQRVMIAMALACEPQLLIADEPTTALDVTIQAQILALMAKLQQEMGMAILMITHDLGVVAEVCDYVIVMYAGKIIEQAPVKDIFLNPKHPYTLGLLESIPALGKKVEYLPSISGMVPEFGNLPSGCRFHERCTKRLDKCAQAAPNNISCGTSHQVSCWLHD